MKRCGDFLRVSRRFSLVGLVALLLACGCSLPQKTPSRFTQAGDDLEGMILNVNRRLIELEENMHARMKLIDVWMNQQHNNITTLQRQVAFLLEKDGTPMPAAESGDTMGSPPFSPPTDSTPTVSTEAPIRPTGAEQPTMDQPAATEAGATQPVTTEAATPQPGETTPATEPTSPVAPEMSDAEKAEALLLKLRACKREEVSGVTKEMKPLSKHLVKPLIEGLTDPDHEFRWRAERALMRLDAGVIMGDIIAALDNARTRSQAVRILGGLGVAPKEVVEKLCGYLVTSDNDDLVFDCASTLVLLRVKEGVPTLISALRSDDEIRRLLAFYTLNKATGYSFDYNYRAAQELREEAVRRWEIWWEENKEKLWSE